MQSHPPPFTLALLAGGESSRMGHAKTDLRVGDQPILHYLLQRWNWERPTLLITAPGHERPLGYEHFDREIADPIRGEGPLRGIVTALANCPGADAVIVVTCDMPLVTRAMLDHLAAKLFREPDALGVMTTHGQEIEPFPFAVRPSALPVLEQRLAANARSLHALASQHRFRLIDAPREWDDAVWTNLNSPEDYRRFMATIHPS